ncbi:MAG: hypothetical protein EAX95_14980 [Candidatus Thorarchaeota archaeon]|nr:hypothetical protein [Candidatus Thorarchaeota archaeon]
MPKAMYSVFWDDTLGPMVGRSYPEDNQLTGEEALSIFMGHGVNQEAKLGYTKLKRGLVLSYMVPPNCIGVLLDKDDDPAIIERNLERLVPEINLDADDWDREIQQAFDRLLSLIDEATGPQLLRDPEVQRFLEDLSKGRIDEIKPHHVLKGIAKYPVAAEYFGAEEREVERKLKDLSDAGVLVPRTYGRKIVCRQCGSEEVIIELRCPICNSTDLHKVYSVYCPNCRELTHSVLDDDLEQVACLNCKKPMLVSDLTVIDVEPLCSKCGTATNEPKIVFACAQCGTPLKGADLLSGTGLGYYPKRKPK